MREKYEYAPVLFFFAARVCESFVSFEENVYVMHCLYVFFVYEIVVVVVVVVGVVVVVVVAAAAAI